MGGVFALKQLHQLLMVWVFTAHIHVPHVPIVKTTVHKNTEWYSCTSPLGYIYL